jgi:hypothetical protein
MTGCVSLSETCTVSLGQLDDVVALQLLEGQPDHADGANAPENQDFGPFLPPTVAFVASRRRRGQTC